MITTINGISYREMMDYGLRNLVLHCEILNGLNVFPVPDGDTGTNMVLTLQGGFRSIREAEENLSLVAKEFGSAIIFCARGNSGVIASQFFRGMAERFSNVEEANVQILVEALELGVEYAHAAVATPVEGTILTVIREATYAVKEKLSAISTMNEAIDIFMEQAEITLQNTPNLLPVLRDAGVVDSGGAGIVYFFEGIKKYLNGEPLQAPVASDAAVQAASLELSNEEEAYGYCTEYLLQLMAEKEPFVFTEFKQQLSKMGDSLVTFQEGDKVKVHIHSFAPGEVLQYGQRFGEFITIKIENMAVQHTDAVAKAEETKFLVSSKNSEGAFAIVAVAADNRMGQTFLEMGADVVVVSHKNLSSEDFIHACEKVTAKEILLFPNNSNSIMAAKQAAELYQDAHLTVIRCGDIAKCYASLAIMDFGEVDMETVVEIITQTIDNLYTVAISRSVKTMQYGQVAIEKDDFISMSGDTILAAEKTLEAVVLKTVQQVMEEEERGVITLFYNTGVSEQQLAQLIQKIQEPYMYLEVYTVPTEERLYDLSISFE